MQAPNSAARATKYPGGLHGVGVSVVNALSSWLRAEVHRDGGAYAQEYALGKKKSPVKKIGSSKLHGTVITYLADDGHLHGRHQI